MDDNKVQTLFRDVPSGSLILIEDMWVPIVSLASSLSSVPLGPRG